MSTRVKIFIILFVVGLFILISIGTVTLATYNREVVLRTAIEAKQKDNQSEFDNLWKKIRQSVQVAEKQKDGLKEIFISYAEARDNSKSDNLLMEWVQESVPQANLKTYDKLMDIITTSRDQFTYRQKELIDLKREHDTLLRKFPSNMILSWFGRNPIEIQVVTSTKTDVAFKSQKDEDEELFK